VQIIHYELKGGEFGGVFFCRQNTAFGYGIDIGYLEGLRNADTQNH
jgi:hypothetical protein